MHLLDPHTETHASLLRDLEGASYLVADYTLLCSGARYEAYRVYAACVTVAVVFGFPASVGALAVHIHHKRHLLQDSAFSAKFGFVYDKYREQYFWWEVTEVMHLVRV